MEQILHFQHLEETLSKKVIKEIETIERERQVIDGEVCHLELKKAKRFDELVTLSLDEYKEAMSKNDDVVYSSTTIRVTENPEKNTISFKKYRFEKKFVEVKNLKRKRWKIVRSEIIGITVNKITGDYYTFTLDRKSRYQTFNRIRKNILTTSGKIIINTICSGLVGDKAQEIFYTLLGYDPVTISYPAFIEKYFKPLSVKLDPIQRNSLPTLLNYNFLAKHGIEIPLYHEFPILIELLYKDKNKFYHNNSTLLDVLCYKYKINRLIGSVALMQYNYMADQHQTYEIGRYYSARNTNPNEYYGFCIKHMRFVPLMFDLIKRYQPDADVTFLNSLLLVTATDATFVKFSDWEYKIFDEYKFELSDFSHHFQMDIVNSDWRFKFIRHFKPFGVKLKFDKFGDITKNINDIYRIFDALCEARSHTGTVIMNQEFYNKIKNDLPLGARLKTRTELPIKQIERHYSHTQKQGEYLRQYNDNRVGAKFDIQYCIEKISVLINFDAFESKNHTEINSRELSEWIIKLKNNTDGYRDSVELRQIYDRNWFENYCLETFGINARDYIVYLD